MGGPSLGGERTVANRNFIIRQYDEIDREQTRLTLSVGLPVWHASLTLRL